MEGNFVVYILLNTNKKRYIGITSDIVKRMEEHNIGRSEYTSHRGPWNLLWNSKNMSHTEALTLEKLMKRQKGGNGLIRLMKDFSHST